ncbi:MBL fold metallo-hydrolase [Paenibacillus aurantius]|uniref:MBL fold metallo-hydrolase n=1 Tax=Paenibacillus aurantius TaxID=2918900 RepID=A0AA96LL38_9BACL|nr:MBL fold metallo-hydrolase [Paenibacillus aurantius]WNQ13367.1 MBL fold metallo-hydrolase [Paenibacillus aurantius]
MRFTFLGTGAAEGIPSPFCSCPACTDARLTGGKNVRRRQSVLINDDLLVDLGPDVFASCAAFGISLTGLRHVLITHSHLDHFSPDNLKLRARGFRLETELPEIDAAGPPSVWMKWEESGGSDREAGIRRRPVLPGSRFELGAYRIRSLPAVHQLRTGDAMNYVIDDGTATLLYASDTGYYEEEVWKELEGYRFDTVIMEGTLGFRSSGREHLNFGDLGRMMERLEKIGAIGRETVRIATHFSHQSVEPYEETCRTLKAMGIECAFDGLTRQAGNRSR